MPIFFLTPPNHPNDLLSIEESAIEASTCQKTIRRWIYGGILPAQRGADLRWHVRRLDLEAFLNTRTKRAA